jgi:hypothetical protein
MPLYRMSIAAPWTMLVVHVSLIPAAMSHAHSNNTLYIAVLATFVSKIPLQL